MKTVLLVEDDIKILYNNRDMLAKRGYRVLTAENLAQARERLANEQPDIAVLDIMLPDGNGLDFLQELRAAGSKLPIIMLTAWGETADRIKGLNMGANDYIGKPFDYHELQARIESVLRSVEYLPESITYERLELKFRSQEVHFGDKKVKLSGVEFFTLYLLIENEGKDVDHDYLYQQVWGMDMNNDPNAVRNAVLRLRGKIEGSGYRISAIYGVGYRFERERKSEL